MDDLDALIARLGKATGPDRELADGVLFACGWTTNYDAEEMSAGRKNGYILYADYDNDEYHVPFTEAMNDCCWYRPGQRGGDWIHGHLRPNPLESFDAAMQLVPEGYYLAEFGDCLTHWKARLAPREAHPTIPRGHMNHYCGFNDGMKPKTGPNAITIAALKARKQSNG